MLNAMETSTLTDTSHFYIKESRSYELAGKVENASKGATIPTLFSCNDELHGMVTLLSIAAKKILFRSNISFIQPKIGKKC